MKTSFINYFFYLIAKNVRLTGSQNVLNFGMKSSKSRRFLELRPRPLLGDLTTLHQTPSREGLLAFGNRSFAPSALSPFLALPDRNSRLVSPPKRKILEPPLVPAWRLERGSNP